MVYKSDSITVFEVAIAQQISDGLFAEVRIDDDVYHPEIVWFVTEIAPASSYADSNITLFPHIAPMQKQVALETIVIRSDFAYIVTKALQILVWGKGERIDK